MPLFASVALLLALLLGAVAPPVAAAEARLRQAIQAREAGDHARALELLERDLATAREPGARAALFFQRGYTSQLMGRAEAALSDYGSAIALDQGKAVFFEFRGVLLAEIGRSAEALADLERALALEPDRAHARAQRGALLLEAGRTEEAAAELWAALSQSPKLAWAWRELGRARLAQGRDNEALAALDQALALAPDDTRGLWARAEARRRAGHTAEARADLARLARLLPNNAEVARALAASASRPPAAAKADPGSQSGTVGVAPRVETGQASSPPPPPPPQPQPPPEPPERLRADAKTTAALAAPCGQVSLPPGDEDDPAPPTPAPGLEGLRYTLARAINGLTRANYQGAVAAAMEAMRLLAGPMDPAAEARFQTMWIPLFDFPSARVVAWLERLNPLLVELLTLLGDLQGELTAWDAAMFEAEMAAAYQHESSARQAMDELVPLAAGLDAKRRGLARVSADIRALGDPPDPREDKCRARRRLEKHLKELGPPEPVEGEGVWVLWSYTIDDRRRQGETSGYNLTRIAETGLALGLGGSWEWSWVAQWQRPPTRIKPGQQVSTDFKVRRVGGGHRHPTWDRPFNYQCWLTVKDGTLAQKGARFNRGWNQAAWSPEKIEWGTRAYFFPIRDPKKKKSPGKHTWRDDVMTLVFKVILHNNKQARLDMKNAKVTGRDSAARRIDMTARIDESTYHQVKEQDADWLFTRTYVYRWQAPGTKVAVLGGMDQNSLAERDEAEKKRAARARKDQEQAEALAEEIAYHRRSADMARGHLQKLDRELERETDPARRAELMTMRLRKQAEMQQELDAAASLETGRFVRTRTAYDEFLRAQMLAASRKQAAEIQALRGAHRAIIRMIATMPENEAVRLDEIRRRQVADRYGDLKHVRELGWAIAKQVQGHHQGQAAAAEEEAAKWGLAVDICQNYQTAASLAMYATPFVAGGPALALAYGLAAGTVAGYQDGGVLGEQYRGTVAGAAVGAAETALRFYSPAADYALSFVEGYQAGGLEGGATSLAWTFIQRKAVQKATQAGLRYQSRYQAARSQAKLDAWRQAQRRVEFKQQQKWGEALAKRQYELYLKHKALRDSGASVESRNAALKPLLEATAAVKLSPHAKGYLKFRADPAHQQAYLASERLHTSQVVGRFKAELTRQGYDTSELTLRPIRNLGNTTPGMDLDLAVSSKRGEVVTWHDPASGKVTSQNLLEANHRWQGIFDTAYAQSSGGRSARASWQMVTTAKHAEAYQDVAWLQVKANRGKGIDPLAAIDPRWAENAARVTQHKANELSHQLGLGRDNRNWEIMRGTAKDIDTKVLPLLQTRMQKAGTPAERLRLQKSLDFYTRMRDVMLSSGEDPVGAEQRLRMMTGHDPVETVQRVTLAIETQGKWQ